jgi:hypothetical protein
MSGNVTLEKAAPESTNTFEAASDHVGGAQVQLTKMVFGDANTAQRVDAANPMPVVQAGAATASAQTTGNNALASIDSKLTGAATEATLAQVRDSIRAQIDIASTIWTDNSGAFYVRRDSVDQGSGTVTVLWTAPDGTTAAPGAGLRPLSTLDRDVTQALFDATSGGTGYSPGDLLARVLIIDANVSPANLTAIWVNLTTGAVIASPTGGTIERADESIGARQVGTWNVNVAASVLATGAATEATLTAIQTLINTLSGTVQNHNAPFVDGSAGQVMLGKRRDSDTTLVADGDLNTINMDEEGRVKVASKPASYADITGDITNVQPTISAPVAGGAVAGDVSRASNVQVFCTGVFAGVNCTFEGSTEATGDTNWFGIQAVRSNANTIETTTGVLGGQPAYAWEMSVNALKRVRVRCTARTSGTQSWRFVLGTYATEPIPAAQVTPTQPVSLAALPALVAGTARAGFVAGGGIWFDDSSTNLGANATFTGTSRDLTVTATATAFANAATYAQELRVGAESDATGTLWLEVSRDNVNWRRIKSVPTTAVAGAGFYAEIVHRPSWRYARAGFTNGAGAQTRFTINSVLMAV